MPEERRRRKRKAFHEDQAHGQSSLHFPAAAMRLDLVLEISDDDDHPAPDHLDTHDLEIMSVSSEDEPHRTEASPEY